MPKVTPRQSTATAATMSTAPMGYSIVRGGIVELLQTARSYAARQVNALMTASYWEIGRRIVEAEQKDRRKANYGEQLMALLSVDLSTQFGRGFSVANLQQMRNFYALWPADKIYQTVSVKSLAPPISQTVSGKLKRHEKNDTQNYATLSRNLTLIDISNAFPLPWSAYVRLLSVKDDYARRFYETEALRGGWSVRQLDRQVNSQFYERTALSKNKVAMLTKGAIAKPEDEVTPDEAIKDPLLLEFLNLKDEYSESELEDALIHRLEDFLLELGRELQNGAARCSCAGAGIRENEVDVGYSAEG